MLMITPYFDKATYVKFYLIDCNPRRIEQFLGYQIEKNRKKIYGHIKILNSRTHFALDKYDATSSIIWLLSIVYIIIGFIMIIKFHREYYSGDDVNKLYMMANLALF